MMYAEVAVGPSHDEPLGETFLDELASAARDAGYHVDRTTIDRFRHPRALYGEAKREEFDLYTDLGSWAPVRQYWCDPDVRLRLETKAPVADELTAEVREDRYEEAVAALAEIGLDPLDDPGKRL